MSSGTPYWFGRYELVGKLGMGGMGELYVARQWGPEGMVRRDVVVKVMLPDASHRFPGADRMFLEEMRILAGINHPNVVQIIDFGRERDVLYMVMEYVRGVTLDDLWSQLGANRHALPPDLVASLIGLACRGLHAAHELRDEDGRPRCLVHRDVSPQNIMCTSLGAVKVIDFGIAWAVDRVVEVTRAAMVKGKLTYMAPEQLRAQPLTRTADVFAMGIVLYELLTGQRLFKRAEEPASVAAILAGEVQPLRSLRADISPRLEAVVHRALSPDPALRPVSAAALADELERVVQEAGGRFAAPDAAARYLVSAGARLTPLPPAPISQPPWFVAAPVAITPKESLDHESTTLQTIFAPLGDSPVENGDGGHRIVLRSISIDPRRQRGPVSLPLGSEVLPVPLRLSAPRPGALVVEAEPQLTPDGRSRMGLYHNADDPPERRRANITISASSREQCFYVGHRRARLRPVRCDSVRGDGREVPRVSLSAARFTIVAAAPVTQFAVLYTTDDDKTLHATCVSVL